MESFADLLKVLIFNNDLGKSMSEAPGGGRADDVPAMLSEGEFVFPAWAVSKLGNGDQKAGADYLAQFLESIKDGVS